MNYYVNRQGQIFGPYSLADLQRYLAQGNVVPGDLARAEGTEEWVPVERVVGNIAVQPAPAQVNYGQVPVYGQAGTAAQPGVAAAGPVPLGLHWGLLLLLSIVTCFIFSSVWAFVEAAYAQKLRTKSKPLIFYGIGIPLAYVANFMRAFMRGYTRAAPLDSGIDVTASLLLLGAVVLIIAGHFSLKNALEEYYNGTERYGLQLSGVMVFFFNVFYFQYHLSRIREWKLSGGGPRSGIIYTPSELEAMRNRPQGPQ